MYLSDLYLYLFDICVYIYKTIYQRLFHTFTITMWFPDPWKAPPRAVGPRPWPRRRRAAARQRPWPARRSSTRRWTSPDMVRLGFQAISEISEKVI